MNKQLSDQPFIPIILGASIGVYSIARSFHEAYGVASINICRNPAGAINHSAILDPMIVENMEEETVLLACLTDIGSTYPDTPKLLIGSDDWHIEMIVSLENKLDNEWIAPYTDQESLQKVIDKTKFYDSCHELGVDYPEYISLDQNTSLGKELPFSFPVVIKPTNRVTYDSLNFTGKKKVFTANHREELDDTIDLIRNGGYQDHLIIQEFVPGDDTAMHILTLYIAQNGELKLAAFGQTLLEDHTPGGIGNPLAIRTLRNDHVVKQAERIVRRAGFIGFANFDLKYDKRDGKYKFFELNPRLGRSNYYITAEGHNPVEYYVNDYIENQPLSHSIADREVLYSVVPKRLLLNHISQQSLQQTVATLYKQRLAKNPMFYFSVEKDFKRLFYVFASTVNFYRKFKKHSPE